MSFFGKVDKSTTGAVISKVAKLSIRAANSTEKKPIKPGQGRKEIRRSLTARAAPAFDVESWFIGALVGAGQCSAHAQSGPTCSPHRRFKQLQTPRSGSFTPPTFFEARRSHTTSCEVSREVLGPPPISPAQLHGLVDQYDIQYNPQDFAREVYELAPTAELVVSDKPDDLAWPPQEYQWDAKGATLETLRKLSKTLQDRHTNPSDVYHIYRELPSPRIPYLKPRLRHMLLRHLSKVERKNEQSMLQYLSVVDDAKINNIPLSVNEWNSALSFVARYMARTTGAEVEAALQLFKEMENAAEVPANTATFNILFDAATKAGKYQLAEMIYNEMTSRGLHYNRFHHVSLIYYFGLKEDGEGVRKAYKNMVDAGEIIDTVAMNAVIASLIKAREPQAAMQVYERMIRLCSENKTDTPATRPPIRNYKRRRELDRALVGMASHARRNPELLEKWQQNKVRVAPDVQTYKILINYAAVEAGTMQAATKLLDEMNWFGLPMNGSIFLALFHGFAKHGAELYSYWTVQRLESVWTSFMKCVHAEDNPDVYLGKWVIIWSLRAFAKCCGIERTRQVWEEIMHEWKGSDEDMDHVRKELHHISEKYKGERFDW